MSESGRITSSRIRNTKELTPTNIFHALEGRNPTVSEYNDILGHIEYFQKMDIVGMHIGSIQSRLKAAGWPNFAGTSKRTDKKPGQTYYFQTENEADNLAVDVNPTGVIERVEAF